MPLVSPIYLHYGRNGFQVIVLVKVLAEENCYETEKVPTSVSELGEVISRCNNHLNPKSDELAEGLYGVDVSEQTNVALNYELHGKPIDYQISYLNYGLSAISKV